MMFFSLEVKHKLAFYTAKFDHDPPSASSLVCIIRFLGSNGEIPSTFIHATRATYVGLVQGRKILKRMSLRGRRMRQEEDVKEREWR